MRHIWLLLACLLPSPCWAEYRAFLLQVYDEEGNPTRQITSTLDQTQYTQYYPLKKGESIAYVNSWMCWNSGAHFSRLCPDPASLSAVDQLPDNTTNEGNVAPDNRPRFPAQEREVPAQ